MDIEFSHLLWTCGIKECGLYVDRICGMLGMAYQSITKKINPIHAAQERQVFPDAFRAAI
jgi:hypothetical protein